MKSLIDYIKESLQLNESKKEMDSLIKAIKSGNSDNIVTVCEMIVSDNKDNLIDSTDTDDLEDGMFVGILDTNKNESKHIGRIVIVHRNMDTDKKQYYSLYAERSGKIEFDESDKLQGDIFGTAWKIVYFEHVDEDVIDAMFDVK